jgi:3-oxocholest-4-en-26-oyl-CoA dehydrogenase alpha subunit
VEFRRERDEAFAAKLREFIAREYPAEFRARRFEWPFDWDFNRAFTAWQAEHLADPSAVTIQTFIEELDRAEIELRPVLPTGLVAGTLAAVGTEQQKREILDRFLRGDALACLGYTEPDSGSDVAAAKTRAVRDGDDWIINGQKMFTTNAELATHVFLLTRTNPEVPKHQGLTMFIIPMDTPGIEVRPLQTLRGHRTNMTFYNDVRVPDTARVGEVDGGWKVMRVALDIEHGAGPFRVRRQVAAALEHHGYRLGAVLARAVAWARTAEMDDGTKVIDNLATRERLARVTIESEVAKLLSARNDPEASNPGVGNGAKLYSSEAYLRGTAELVDIAGSRGLLSFTEEDSVGDGWVEYAFRDSPVSTIAAGSSEVQRDIIAERRLGLPTARSKSR